MTITKQQNQSELTIILEGRLDTTTAPTLEAEVTGSVDGIDSLVFDFTDIEYISSAGLRVLLLAQKLMAEKGKMVVKNVNDTVNEVFEITGFCDILTIE